MTTGLLLVASACSACTDASDVATKHPSEAIAPSGYAFASTDAERAVAGHPEQRLRYELDGRALVAAPANDAWWLRMEWRRWGRDDETSSIDTPATVSVEGRIARHTRALGVEWYRNGPAGLEHGFTFDRRPPGHGPLWLELAVEGLSAAPTEGGARLHAAGTSRMFYTDLHAWDASGRSLPVEMRVTAGALRLRVDDRHAAYPVVVDPTLWLRRDVLPGGGSNPLTEFGRSLDCEGDRAVVGAIGSSTFDLYAGKAIAYVRTGTQWLVEQELSPTDVMPLDYFGWSVDLDQETIAVGAADKNAAYVFAYDGSSWTEQQKLIGDDPGPGAEFGWRVAVDGPTLAVSAPHDSAVEAGAGAIYVFVRAGSSWNLQQRLEPIPGGGGIGQAMALDGDTLITSGLSDDVTVYMRSGQQWLATQQLHPSDEPMYPRDFGRAFALDGNRLVVTRPGQGTGKAYYFVRSGGTWTEQQVVVPSDGNLADRFGAGASLHGDHLLIANEKDAVYFFEWNGATWVEDQKYSGSQGNELGEEVALCDDSTALLGAPERPDVEVVVFAQEDGDSCTQSDECGSGHCVDGVCCNGPCGALCASCALAGSVGTCMAIPFGEDPDNECPGGSCNGGETCKLDLGQSCSTGSACSSGNCTDGICCDTACSGACESCNQAGLEGTCTPFAAGATGTPSCAPHLCDGQNGACPEACASDDECASYAYCGGSDCIDKLPQGSTCTVPESCVSGFCERGICCDQTCNGGCASCEIPGALGVCTALNAGSEGNPSCAPLLCNGIDFACPATCSGDTDCAAGTYCETNSGECRPPERKGSPCVKNSGCESNMCVDGVCCDSACGDGATTDCQACSIAEGSTVDGQCEPIAAGSVCRASSGTCDAAEVCDGLSIQCPVDAPPSCPAAGSGGGGNGNGSGCTMSASSDRHSAHWWLLALALVGLCRNRRRVPSSHAAGS
jgi:hypothetical protein